MKQSIYTYTTTYSEHSFKNYAYVLYKLRGKIRKLLILLFAGFFGLNGILMVPSGTGDLPTAILMIVLAIILVVYYKNTPKRLAKAMIKNSEDFDEYRKIEYSFFTSHFSVKDLDIETEIEYSKLYDLVETRENIFLFTKPRVAYIIAISDILNKEEFTSFLEQKTNKTFTILS